MNNLGYLRLISCWKHDARSDSFHIGQGSALSWCTL